MMRPNRYHSFVLTHARLSARAKAAVLTMTLCLGGALAAPVVAEAHDGVHITDPYARASGAVGASGAVFFTIDNHQIADDRLIGVTSDVAEKVEIHTHVQTADGVMQMIHLEEGLPVPANGEAVLARGGDHVMLMGLTRALTDGDIFTLTLRFERAGEVVVEVPVDNARTPKAADHGAGHGTGHGTGHGMGHGAAAAPGSD